MALIAAHLNAKSHCGGDSAAIGIQSTSPPTSVPSSPLLPAPNKAYGSVDVKHHVYLLILCDLFAYVYSRGTSVYCLIRNFVCVTQFQSGLYDHAMYRQLLWETTDHDVTVKVISRLMYSQSCSVLIRFCTQMRTEQV